MAYPFGEHDESRFLSSPSEDNAHASILTIQKLLLVLMQLRNSLGIWTNQFLDCPSAQKVSEPFVSITIHVDAIRSNKNEK